MQKLPKSLLITDEMLGGFSVGFIVHLQYFYDFFMHSSFWELLLMFPIFIMGILGENFLILPQYTHNKYSGNIKGLR